MSPDEREFLARADAVAHASRERGLSADEVWGDMVDRIEAAGIASPAELRLLAACQPNRIRALLLRGARVA